MRGLANGPDSWARFFLFLTIVDFADAASNVQLRFTKPNKAPCACSTAFFVSLVAAATMRLPELRLASAESSRHFIIGSKGCG